jgi:uncharacterized phage-like protein YoqJ
MNIGFTGHRPPKVFYKHDKVYTQECFDILYDFVKGILIDYTFKPNNNYNTGGALGFDTVVAEYILNSYPIETKNKVSKCYVLNLYLPFKSFGSKWYSKIDKDRLEKHKKLANKVNYVSETNNYSVRLMMDRNKAIVDNSDVIIALWDGNKSGTKNCVDYAKKQGKEVINIWSDWVKYYEEI